MWDTVLHIKYEDFELGNEDIIVLKDLIIQFTKNLQNQCEELCESFLLLQGMHLKRPPVKS